MNRVSRVLIFALDHDPVPEIPFPPGDLTGRLVVELNLQWCRASDVLLRNQKLTRDVADGERCRWRRRLAARNAGRNQQCDESDEHTYAEDSSSWTSAHDLSASFQTEQGKTKTPESAS